MPKYYFDIETHGPNAFPSPFTDKIITIQYQELGDVSGEAIGELTILKEWESSEEGIFRKFFPLLQKWGFIMVGNNLGYEKRFLIEKAKQYKLPLNEYELNYDFPCIDIQSIFVLLNRGQFRGCGMHNFTEKKMDGSYIKKWYEGKEYGKIEGYVRDEAAAFVKFYSQLCAELPKMANKQVV